MAADGPPGDVGGGAQRSPWHVRALAGFMALALCAMMTLTFVDVIGRYFFNAPADETGFWPVLLIAIALGLFLATDKSAYSDAVIDGMSRRIVMIMLLAWLLAGVFGVLLRESGLVGALVWATDAAGVSGGGFVAVSFLVCVVFSTATGTSLGTILVCAPLLYPAGASLAADPAFLIGAIPGGDECRHPRRIAAPGGGRAGHSDAALRRR